MDPLIGSVTDTLAARWNPYVIGGAVLFWLLGASILLVSHPDILQKANCQRWHELICWAHINKTGGQAAGIILAVLVIVGTAALMSAIAEPVLALLAGHRGANSPLAGWRRRRLNKRRIGALRRTTPAHDDPERRRFPAVSNPSTDLAPTRIGNAQSAALRRIHDAYGLDLATSWPVLLVLLPDEVYRRLATASGRVLARVQHWILSLVTIGWLPLLWTGHLHPTPQILWISIFVVGWALCSWSTFRRVRSASYEYFDLVEAVVTAHRHLLYKGLGLAPPADTDAEPQRGQEMSAYLNRENTQPEPLTW